MEFTLRSSDFSDAQVSECDRIGNNEWSFKLNDHGLIALCGRRGSLAGNILTAIVSEGFGAAYSDGTVSAYLGENRVSDIPANTLSTFISFLPENLSSFFVNQFVDEEIGFAFENLATPPRKIIEKIRDTASTFEICNLLEQRLSQLSGGQKQLVAIAAALCTPAQTVLLDKPFTNLDACNRKLVLEVLKLQGAKGRRIIFSTLDWCDWIPRSEQLCIFDCKAPAYIGPPLSREETLNRMGIPDERRFKHSQGVSSPQESARNGVPFIQFHNVSFQYPSQNSPTLRSVSFNISLNGVVGIIGTNGSGKTTLAKLVSGLQKPTSGHIEFSKFDSLSTKPNVAYIFQEPEAQFLMDTVLGEIRSGLIDTGDCEARNKRTNDLLELYGLERRCSIHPLRLNRFEQRKTLMAASEAAGPNLLILDEPTEGLDGLEKMEIERHINRLRENGLFVFVISHDKALLENLTRFFIAIQDGHARVYEMMPGDDSHVHWC